MCNQSIGLIARVIEEAGIPTSCIMLSRDIAEKVKAPRALHVKWPLGHPFGEPDKPAQQYKVLADVLSHLKTAGNPGELVDLAYRWKREEYPDPETLTLPLA